MGLLKKNNWIEKSVLLQTSKSFSFLPESQGRDQHILTYSSSFCVMELSHMEKQMSLNPMVTLFPTPS